MYTILLADDDADDAEIFQEALYNVNSTINFVRVENGAGIFDYLNNSALDRPQVIFLDLNMPEMNGWQCLAKLKNTDAYEGIPVIMYTTSSHPRDKEIALDLKAVGLITKPSNPSFLERFLQMILNGIKDQRLKEAVHDVYLISRE